LDISEALNLAKGEELDLVEISPVATPPVCKIMDFGRFKYKLSKKEKDSKKKQHIVHIKEIRFRPKIEKHDFDFKVKNARKFIEQGNKLKVTVIFRGREVIYQEFGMNVLKKVEKQLSDIAKIDSPIKKEGRNLITYFIKK